MALELRTAIRTLLRNPGFAAAVVVILALGSAAATTIFSITHAILLRDLPYDQPDRLVTIGTRLPKAGFPKAYAGPADYFDWRKRNSVFQDMALTRAVANFNLTGVAEPERLVGGRTTASLFSTLRVTPLIGRTFTEEEQLDPERAASVAVLSYGLWRRRFGSDPAIIGRKVMLNGRNVEILGVMRPEFQYPNRNFELWAPLYFPPQALKDRFDFSYICVGRLKPGVTVGQAGSQMNVIAADLAREYPSSNTDVGVYVEPMLGNITETARPALTLLLASVGVLYLVGCVNLAGLLLSRAVVRQKEFAIRRALGATRMRLARQCFLEMMPLTAAGAALGVLAASWLVAILVPMLPAATPRVEEIGIHAPVLIFATILSIVTALAISGAPAMQVSANVERGPLRHGRILDGLVVAEVASSVVLLIGAGLLIRSFINVRGTPPGFEPKGVLALHLAVDRPAHGSEDRDVARYLTQLMERVQSVPGIQFVGMVNRLPLGGQAQTLTIEFEGRQGRTNIDSRIVGGDYFRALGIPILTGRAFRDDDLESRPPVGIIDERMARDVFGKENPLGKRFRISLISGMPWVRVVGVVGHVHHEGLDNDPRPQVYWPYWQRTQDRMAMVVKTAGDPGGMTGAVRGAIREVDPNQPLYEVQPMTEVVERSLLGRRINMLLVGFFSGLALLLASIGLSSVVSNLTSRRSREFGIRLALGASPGDLLQMTLKQGLVRATCGLVLGLLLSGAVTRLLRSLLSAVNPLDTLTYASVTVVLLLVVLAASYPPARRASKTDPVRALQCE